MRVYGPSRLLAHQSPTDLLPIYPPTNGQPPKQEASALLEMSVSRAGLRSQQPEGEEGRSVVVASDPAAGAEEEEEAVQVHEGDGGKGMGVLKQQQAKQAKQAQAPPVAAGPAVIGGQMRRLAWVAREREQAVGIRAYIIGL